MDNTENNSHSFKHEILVADLPKNRPYDFELSPKPKDLKALAAELDILDVSKLRFNGTLEFSDLGELKLTADLGVSVTQACVVSLEPVKSRIDEAITRRFIKLDDEFEEERQMLPEEDENTDPMTSVIDLGLVMLESIALNLPDFPRIEGAELKQKTFTEAGAIPMTDEDTKPFAGLAALKDKLSSKN